jgi:opacity protein-like surface antigen
MSDMVWSEKFLIVFTAAAVFALLPSAAAAQGESSTGAYVFYGTGGISPDDVFPYWKGRTTRVGVGLEHVFASGFLLQGDLEWLTRSEVTRSEAQDTPSNAFFSINAGYEFGRARVRPFASGGGFTFLKNASSFIYNIGGGVNVRVVNHVALRAEFRNHRLFFDEPINSYGFRVGVTIR